MDTNLVLPISPSHCRVVFDWFLDSSLVVYSNFYLNVHNIITFISINKGVAVLGLTLGGNFFLFLFFDTIRRQL